MKRLITAKIIKDFVNVGGSVFEIDDNTLITPSAKDEARNSNVTFACASEIEKMAGKQQCELKNTQAAEDNVKSNQSQNIDTEIDRKQVIEEIVKILKEKNLI